MTNNIAKCGCDCFNCPTYRDNIRTKESRQNCSTGWAKYFKTFKMEGKISRLFIIIFVLSSCCQCGKYQGAPKDTTRNTPEASNISSDSSNHWTRKADFGGVKMARAVGFSIDNKGYIGTGAGGFSSYKDFWEYNPINNAWTRKADFGGTERSNAVGFSIGTKGYIGTGYSYKKDFWEYDPSVNSWTRKADFGGTPRNGAVGFSIGIKGYIGTGTDKTDNTHNFGHTNTKDFWEFRP